jgi:predicted phosphodiesterase
MTTKPRLRPWDPEPYQAYDEYDDPKPGVFEGVRSRRSSTFSILTHDAPGQRGQNTGNAAGPGRVQIGDGDENEDEDDLYAALPPRKRGSLPRPHRQKPKAILLEPTAFPKIESESAFEQSVDPLQPRTLAPSLSPSSVSPSSPESRSSSHKRKAARMSKRRDTGKSQTNTSENPQTRNTRNLSTGSAQGIRFHYVSDLHLELEDGGYDTWDFTATAPYLILAGDIGSLHPAHRERYRRFLIRMCQKPIIQSVFWVAGNHEYSHSPDNTPGVGWRDGVGIARRMATDPVMGGKLIYLENDRTFIRERGVKVVILGATLWTWTPDGHAWDDETQNTNRRNVNHADSVKFLKKQVARIRSQEWERDTHILIITHHAPSKSGTLDPNLTAPEPDDEIGYTYATDLLDGVRQPGTNGYNHGSVKTQFPQLDDRDVWIHGHTHWMSTFGQVRANGVRLLSNQRGYKQERGPYGPDRFPFDASRTVEI